MSAEGPGDGTALKQKALNDITIHDLDNPWRGLAVPRGERGLSRRLDALRRLFTRSRYLRRAPTGGLALRLGSSRPFV